MKRFISYGSIEQFKSIIIGVKHQAQYVGMSEDNKPIYNKLAPMPIVNAVATEKIHGTNAAVCYSNPDGFWVQSRKNIITVEKDNAACAQMAMKYKEEWLNIIHSLAKTHNINLDKNIISVYFEWSGGNIQKKSAVSGLDKRAIIFAHFKVSPLKVQEDDEAPSVWKCTNNIDNKDAQIFNVSNYYSWDIDIDFNNPAAANNEFIRIVEEIVEPNSPIGKEMGQDGNIGEGIVVTFEYKDNLYKFKVKGEAHSNSKVKTLKPVDEVKEQAKIDFATYATPAWRLEQMYQETFDTINGGVGDIKKTGEFLSAVHKDIIKEELDELNERNLEIKEVNGMVSKIARIWFLEQLDREVGL